MQIQVSEKKNSACCWWMMNDEPSLYSPQIKIFGSFFQQQSLSQRLHVFIARPKATHHKDDSSNASQLPIEYIGDNYIGNTNFRNFILRTYRLYALLIWDR